VGVRGTFGGGGVWGPPPPGAYFVRGAGAGGSGARGPPAAPTRADVRDVMVEGESGIRAISPPEWRPKYEPSKRRLVWPNGAIATLYAADKPDQLRGPQHDFGWGDELGSWRYQQEAWANLVMGLRLGSRPRLVVTTTPRPTKLMRDLVKGGRNLGLACPLETCRAPAWRPCNHPSPVVMTRGSTFDNVGNLVQSFFDRLLREYEGTRIGRQELEAEILDDVEGALWTWAMLEARRLAAGAAPENLKRVVVAVDPPKKDAKWSNECGIVVAGLGVDDRGYILADRSGKMSSLAWATAAVRAYYEFRADAIVVEINTGGETVRQAIRLVDENCKIVEVTATRGKVTRAEPASALYEQERVSHVGMFPKLEDQMTSFTPIPVSSSQSPDRVDALVWALHELFDLGGEGFGFA
jgi:phage terminase large subunit-like protein